MIVGMRKFVLLYPHGIRIQSLEEYKEYCYYVAGTVGYLLTDLWHEHSPSIGDAAVRGAARALPRVRRSAADGEHPEGRRDATPSRRTRSTSPRSCCAQHGSSHATILAAERVARNSRRARRRSCSSRGTISIRRTELSAADSAPRRVDPALLRAAAALRLRDAARPHAHAAARSRGARW